VVLIQLLKSLKSLCIDVVDFTNTIETIALQSLALESIDLFKKTRTPVLRRLLNSIPEYDLPSIFIKPPWLQGCEGIPDVLGLENLELLFHQRTLGA
jgi:hypothetical protein